MDEWIWTTLVPCLTICVLAFAQNVSFTLVSRSRNRDNFQYHIVAATLSNFVWFMTFKELLAYKMDWVLMIPYTIGTVSGSVFGVKVSMKIEKWLGAASDSHLDTKKDDTQKKP